MFLEKEDYQEVACPLSRPAQGGVYHKPARQIPLAEVIDGCDRLFNSNQPQKLGEHLRYWREQAAEYGDKESELSILNELIEFLLIFVLI